MSRRGAEPQAGAPPQPEGGEPPLRALAQPLLALFVSNCSQNGLYPKDGEMAKESVGS